MIPRREDRAKKKLGRRNTRQSAPDETDFVAALTVAALGVIDDDWAIKIDGVTVIDEQMNVSWYIGLRTATLAAADIYRRHGLTLVRGQQVEIFTVDGWAARWTSAPWEATITYQTGDRRTVHGGQTLAGQSPHPRQPWEWPKGLTDYYRRPPQFVTYIPNGRFVL